MMQKISIRKTKKALRMISFKDLTKLVQETMVQTAVGKLVKTFRLLNRAMDQWLGSISLVILA